MIPISITIIFILIILIGLFFTLTNGLHDASSVVATFINCGAANPKQAILLASISGLAGLFLEVIRWQMPYLRLSAYPQKHRF